LPDFGPVGWDFQPTGLFLWLRAFAPLFVGGLLAGVCLKGENSRVAAIIVSYPAILPL